MDAVSKEIAEKEVTAWLDFKKVKQNRREFLKGNIENIIACVQDGTFVIQPDTYIIDHKLDIPLGINGQIKTLSYKPRISVGAIQDNTNGVLKSDDIAVTLSYIMALSGESRAILRGIDKDDYSNADTIAAFFSILM